MTVNDSSRHMLRHCLATLAYRGGKTLRGAPAHFAAFRAADSSRTPGEILAHIDDLLDWALSIAKGQQKWHESASQGWDRDVERFLASLRAFDDYLTSNQPLSVPAEKLFQGPIADALTHVGQLAMLRRLAGSPVRGENYFLAEIAAGNPGPQQASPKREFD